MSKIPPHSFYIELFKVLLSDLEKKVTPEQPLKEIRKHVGDAIASKNTHSFPEILETYHLLLSAEKTFLPENFSQETLLLKEYTNQISRGLPRLYNKENPTQSFVKKEFSDIAILKKLADEKIGLPRCEDLLLPFGSKVSLLTYMLPDGWGDLVATKEAFRILKTRFPQLDLKIVLCVPKGFPLEKSGLDPNVIAIRYDRDCPLSLFSKKALDVLKSSHLVLSLPTFYPHTEQLKTELSKTSKILCIGQYGFLESASFHPKSGNYSMGLHFLEKGILIRESPKKADFRKIENQVLLFTFFGTTAPQTVDIERYLATHQLYLAYLISPYGGAIYLHALFQSQMQNPKTIDICSPNLHWLIEYLQICEKEKKPIFTEDFGIKEIEIHFGGKIHRRKLKEKGKKVRIICPGPLSDEDFRNLMRLSEEFVAIRGDQSFSEAVSANRLFFYDGAPHARYFMKDLIALAENRLRNNKAALAVFRCMNQAFMYNREESDSPWVEETYFQEKQPWQEIAKMMGAALQSPSVVTGFKQFNQIIRNEYSFNKALCQMVQRELN